MALADLVRAPTAGGHAFVATAAVSEWLLWGGLAAAFTALYIGVYIWMRRPKFGEGKPSRQPPSDPQPGTDTSDGSSSPDSGTGGRTATPPESSREP